jgi:hypothetical protein
MPDELEYAIKIKFDNHLLHGMGYKGTSLEEYEIRDTFADQEDLTFNIIRIVKESDLDWVSKVGGEREQLLDDLEGRIKLMGWGVDLERLSERTSHDGEWFFGQFWCGDVLYELYETMVGISNDTMEYKYSMNYHSRDDRSGEFVYEDSYDDLTAKELMSKVTRVIVKCLDGDKVNESNDFG